MEMIAVWIVHKLTPCGLSHPGDGTLFIGEKSIYCCDSLISIDASFAQIRMLSEQLEKNDNVFQQELFEYDTHEPVSKHCISTYINEVHKELLFFINHTSKYAYKNC